MEGGLLRPPAETDDGIGLNCSIAQFLSLVTARLGLTAEHGGRIETRGVLSRGFCCHRIPSSS